MSNRILAVTLTTHSSAPAQAEVRAQVQVERLTPTTELRGRLMGPRCSFASTIEVAYHFRPVDDTTLRAVIPEASLWDPVSPFLYEGPVELWQDGVRVDRALVRHGLRRFSLGP